MKLLLIQMKPSKLKASDALLDERAAKRENQTAKRNALVYAACQAFNGAATPVNIAIGGLAGSYLLGSDKSLATIPVASFTGGMAIGAIPAAVLTRYLGRKYGFIIGLIIGIVGMLVAAYALIISSFVLLCSGTLVNGIAAGFGQQYRFAAADRGTPDFKPKAISWVLVGGIAAAVIGPQLIIFTRDLLLPVQFAGAYLSAIALFVVSIAFMAFLDSSDPPLQETSEDTTKARSLLKIITQPRFIVAVLCGTCSFALMSLVMTGAPLAMVSHGISMNHATLGIQWHAIAMFAPSLFTGSLIARFGKELIVATGLCILVGGGIVALMGFDLMHFWFSLILLGVGWNFGFIGATAMITDTYKPSEKNKAQGANDFILFSFVAFASLMSGWVLNNYGWAALNAVIFPAVVISVIALVWLVFFERKKPVEQTSSDFQQ